MNKNIEALFARESKISVEPLYDILQSCSEGFKKFCLLNSAIDLGIFDQLDCPKTVNELSIELKIESSLTLQVLECLEKLGLVRQEADFYQNTSISQTYLTSTSPLAQRNVVKNLFNSLKVWERLSEILKQGPILASEDKFFANNLIHSLAEEALCGELQRTVKGIQDLPEFKNAKTLLDLGGGHGLYATAFTKANPGLVADVYDFPNVVEDTKKYLDKHCADRVGIISGNYFIDNIEKKYDIIFFAYNPGGKKPELIPKIYESLNEGGILISKHCFYSENEKSKDLLLDLEWNLVAFEGAPKQNRIYSFQGDLSLEEYLKLLKKHFDIQSTIQAPEFAGKGLSKVGDALDSLIIVAKKKEIDIT